MPFRFIVFALVSSSALAADLDWPRFRGPDGAGISAAAGVPATWSQDENLRWKIELPGAGTSSPVIVGGKIYLTCYRGFGVPGARGDMQDLERLLICLDAKDGKQLWSQTVPTKLPEQERIRDDHGYTSSTPIVAGDRIYAFFGKSGVFAFDLTGKQLWQADVGDGLNGWGSAASVTLHKNLVLVNASVESESLVALDAKDGKEVWRAKGIKESWATPLVVRAADGKDELIVPIFGQVLSLDPATGDKLWTCNTDIGWYMVPSPVAKDGVIYIIGGRSGGMLAIRAGGRGDVTDTHRLWTGKKGSNVSSPVIHGEHLYWVSDAQGIAYCARLATGEIVYEERLPRGGQFYAPALLLGDKLCYLNREGRAFVLPVGPQYTEPTVNDLRDRSLFHAGGAVSGGRLFLRSDKYLYCVGGK